MVELNEQNWNGEVLQSTLPIIIDFWGESCSPCKVLEPLLEQVEKDFKGKLKFGKVNVRTHGSLAARYGVRNIPTLLLFRDGKVVGQNVGSVSMKILVAFLQKGL